MGACGFPHLAQPNVEALCKKDIQKAELVFAGCASSKMG